jgi:hypothetical protein
MDDDKVKVKPTWGLAWGLWWRMLLINIGIIAIVIGIMVAVGYVFLQSILGSFFGGGWFVP